jgi:lipid-A-disaccharide synthase
MLVSYRLSPITYWLGRLLVKTPFIGLPNIVAGKRIVKEFIQYEATPENLSAEILNILNDTIYAQQIKADLVEVNKRLGLGGGSKRMAELALEMIEAKG